MKQVLIPEYCVEKFNEALYQEMYVSHLYHHIANHMQMMGYFGAQKFFLGESQDELTHFQKIVDFLNDIGEVAKMPSIPAMNEEVESLMGVLTMAYEQEVELMNFYRDFYKSADPVCQQILLKFIEIQRKASGEYGDLIARLEIIKDDPCGLLMFDQELGK
jgi:ferritin